MNIWKNAKCLPLGEPFELPDLFRPSTMQQAYEAYYMYMTLCELAGVWYNIILFFMYFRNLPLLITKADCQANII